MDGPSGKISALDDRDPVDVLAEEFADRLRRGEHPSVSDYASAHPEHAEQLRDLLPAVAQMEHLKRFRRTTGPSAVPSLPDRFGDFRIVRELGRGGMGVVFEAVQESLGRPVALKVLASHSQFDGIRHERFIREAHAAARLHHTNIVPVFGVGEQDSVPYYVMQLIRGQGLNAVARRWRQEQGREDHTGASVSTIPDRRPAPRTEQPTPVEASPHPKYGNWRFVAEVGLQAAEALHYAHKQGVLHRDVKPANLLLDASNRVWITDFGLAKVVDLRGLTPSGDILGTLQYLAPECLSGDSDPRSDVYAVGATLYELLTLAPPYPADSPARLLKMVADGQVAPPRQSNPEIPLDLETIVLKAMAREPDHRYLSARDLARDLQAFLDDRPIKARRQTWSSRMWRLCRRNPAVASLSVAVVAVFILATVVGWVGYAAEARRLNEANQARQSAEEASTRLKENLRLSLATFEAVFEAAGRSRQGFGLMGFAHHERPGGGPGDPHLHGGLNRGPGDPGGPGGPGGGPSEDAAAKAAMLEAVLTFYDKFAEQNPTNPQLQFEAAKGHRRVCEARRWLGENAQAAVSISRAIKLLRTLQAEFPDNAEYDAELVQAYLSAPWEAGDVDESALLWAKEAAERIPTGPTRFMPGLVTLKLAMIRDRSNNPTGAEAAYREAIELLSPSDRNNDDRPPPIVTDQAWSRYSLAMLMCQADRWMDARSVLFELIRELEHVPDRCGRNSTPQLGVMSNAFEQLAVVNLKLGDRASSDEASRNAQLIKRELQEGHGRPGPPPGKGPPLKKKN